MYKKLVKRFIIDYFASMLWLWKSQVSGRVGVEATGKNAACLLDSGSAMAREHGACADLNMTPSYWSP